MSPILFGSKIASGIISDFSDFGFAHLYSAAHTGGMDAATGNPLPESDLQGWQYFRRLRPLLGRPHDAGCARDQAGNRQLHLDQYCALLLLALFSPLARSLRSRSQASGLRKVQEQLGVRRASLGSLSEAAHVFDPDLLVPLIQELAGELVPTATDASTC